MSASERPSHFAWLCAATVLLGALLLFLVQPIISKIILPWFGGTPAVWTTCMLFFQTLLLAGYAYAHWLVRALQPSWQMRVHGFMTLAAALTLPITPRMPALDVERDPVLAILLLLGMNVGLPFLVVAGTGPLLQVWFAGAYPGRPPYRLYALSNFGSLAALWLFPLALEPLLTSGQQDLLWSAGFGAYLVLIFVLSLTYERLPLDANAIVYPERAIGKEPIPGQQLAIWLALPGLASVLLVAVTSHICQDVAVVPFLWILPLSLYLVTFILAFDSPRWYVRGLWSVLAVVAVLAASVVMHAYAIEAYVQGFQKHYGMQQTFKLVVHTERTGVETGALLLALFCVAMICHGETVRHKPPAGRLTLYYLAIAAGSALGSGCVAIACPQVFSNYYELGIGLVAGYLLAGAVLVQVVAGTVRDRQSRLMASSAASITLTLGLSLVIGIQSQYFRSDADIQLRNFYGVASVKTEYEGEGDDRQAFGRVLYNGQINHGYQFLQGERRYQPNAYYAVGSGVDLAFEVLRSRNAPLRVGVIGLGTGTLASFGQPGDDFQFYEIDPKIERIANEYFTYLQDTPAKVHVRMGDARVFLQRQREQSGSQQFDLLVLDAFSGDAIPVHLLTLEAFHLYLAHIRPDGVLAIHVSNRYLDLKPVVARLAREIRASAILVEREDFGLRESDAESDWILVTGDAAILGDPLLAALGERIETRYPNAPRWTDSFSNLLQVLR